MITKHKPKSVTHVPEHLLPMSPVCTLPRQGGGVFRQARMLFV
jgi:hypothetical protein